MRQTLNKKFIASLHPSIAEIVKDWREQYGKKFVSVETRPSVYIQEDAKYTGINLGTGASATGQAVGEFSVGSAGLMRCNENVALPPGCAIVERRFFMGFPYLTIFYGAATALPEAKPIQQIPETV